jgi:uncharacterized membrane-anchored protein
MAVVNASLAPLAAHAGHLAQLADFDQNKVTPGLIGFIVFAAIGGASWLLMKSMNKQFKKIDFEESPSGTDGGDTAAG